uniref:Major histocompatibility complex class I UBA n=1 Tax=Sinocyclocheilus grahami TaxID=75366 RepID=A0A672LRD7_SINGR
MYIEIPHYFCTLFLCSCLPVCCASLFVAISEKKVKCHVAKYGDPYLEFWAQGAVGGSVPCSRVSPQSMVSVIYHVVSLLSGVHAFQFMYGCELDDDGNKRGYLQFGYDGEDVLSFDKNTLTFTAQMQMSIKHILCTEWIKKYGRDTLERISVSLLQKSSSSSVTCQATGFYPKEVTISWQKNGQDHDEDLDLGQLLPNEDGTFQKTSTITVTPDEWKNNQYSCVVEHQGKTIRQILTDDSAPIGIIVGVVAAVLLLVIFAVAKYKVYQKKKASDDGSNSSAHTHPKA